MQPLVNLAGKLGLVVGIANEHSIAAGCAAAFRQCGARLAATYVNDKALPFVEPVTTALGVEWIQPCDVREKGSLETLFARVEKEWGKLDFLLHSIAFAPREDLHGRVVDCSAEGFAMAMDVSCHSFLRMARLAEPLMADGGCLLCVTFYGSERVVEHYNLMGPVKAALESATRYIAAELGPKRIRAHAISPGPIRTRAASGIEDFDELLEQAAAHVPERNWSMWPMSALWQPSLPATPPAISPGPSSRWTAGSTFSDRRSGDYSKSSLSSGAVGWAPGSVDCRSPEPISAANAISRQTWARSRAGPKLCFTSRKSSRMCLKTTTNATDDGVIPVAIASISSGGNSLHIGLPLPCCATNRPPLCRYD